MHDLTLLYYTANTAWHIMTENVRKHLLSIKGGLPLISVSQKPLDFGKNICVGEIGRSYYNCYKQIYIGAQEVKTKYIALCEDDTLYSMEHFSHRPSRIDTFSFNNNMWYTEETMYWNKFDHGMCTCIVERDTLVKTLAPRFIMYPYESMVTERMQRYFQEPGRNDKKFGIPNAKTEIFKTKIPILTFNFFAGLGGKKITKAHVPIVKKDLEPWGDCWTLKKKFWGR
jgi:hypothetical protein